MPKTLSQLNDYVAESRRIKAGQVWRIGENFLLFDSDSKTFTVIRRPCDSFHTESVAITNGEVEELANRKP